MTQCKHATYTPDSPFPVCSLGLYGGRPSAGVCGVCNSYEGPARGFGDTVAKFTKATGIEKLVKAVKQDCGCAKRRITLNQFLPYK